MRPVRLEMQGFSAFRDPTVVDFTDIELVAMVGATGSGKSSIIDALTFALYGSVARYDERAVAPVINQLSTEARVRFEFEIGGDRYSATRVVRRTKAGGATTKEARLERGSEVIAGDLKTLDKQVVALLGLDFARFNKTVVLPQGKFADFLHDKPAARDELLRELLGLGIYQQIAMAARERAAEFKATADALEQADPIDPDLVSEERLSELGARADALAAARDTITVADEQLVAHNEQLRTVRADIAQHDEHLALLVAVTEPAGLEDAARRTEALVAAEQAARADLDAANEALHAATAAAEGGPSRADHLLLQRDHLDLATLEDQAANATQNLETATQAAQSATTSADRVRAEIAEAEQAVTKARGVADDAARQLRSRRERSTVDADIILHEDLARRRDTLTDLEKAAAGAAATHRAALDERERARATFDRARLDAPAALLTATLTAGATCPVCDQVVHTVPHRTPSDTKQLEQATDAARAADAQLEKAAAAATRADHQLEQASHQLDQLERQLATIPNLTTLRDELRELTDLHTAATTTRTELEAAELALRNAHANPDGRSLLDTEQAALANLTRAQTSADDSQRRVDAHRAKLAGAPSLATVEANLVLAEQLELDRRAKADRAQQVAQRHQTQVGLLEQERTLERDARRRYERAREPLGTLAPPAPVDSLIVCWRELIAWREGQHGRITAGRAEQTHLADHLDQQVSQVTGHVRTAVTALVADPTAPISRLREQLAEAATNTRRDLDHLRHERAKQAARVARLTDLRQRAAVATELGRLLRVDGFQRWLFEEALTDLVARATVRLHELTSGQYSLTTTSGGFEVIDHRNADEARDARSLSGGETFLASLALALALADSSIDQSATGTAAMESIFLDEGFGTLDPDTLDIVASSIEELGANGRMVGIVTHIRELAERMPTRIEVTKGPTSSSIERIDS